VAPLFRQLSVCLKLALCAAFQPRFFLWLTRSRGWKAASTVLGQNMPFPDGHS
jgi:hypothetical protein